MSESQLSALDFGTAPRVVGRDGQCLSRDDDRRNDRVNFIIDDGVVIWAGRF
jgi:hypothetical protein